MGGPVLGGGLDAGFTVIVPSPPRWALVAALASASAVPMVSAWRWHGLARQSRFHRLLVLLSVVLPYLLIVADRLRRRARRVQPRRRAHARAGARQLPAGRAARAGRHGRGVARAASAAGASRGDQADAAGSARRLARRAAVELHARFEREAQATASLRSPHTIELYDFGVADDGAFYYVMELLDGFDLETLVERFGPLPAERAVHLLTQVCHSLAEAHAAGLVHRDIKPANVYVCRYGREVDFVKVLDFGLVKSQRDAERRRRQRSPRHHAVGGTPAFMSPEQVMGDRPIDGRSDIYAVGCLAYWLVTGQLVFTGRTAIETMLQHAQATPVPPSQRTELEIPRRSTGSC